MTKFKVGDKIKLGRDVETYDLKAGDFLTVKEMDESFGQIRYKFHETAFHFSVGSNIEFLSTLAESTKFKVGDKLLINTAYSVCDAGSVVEIDEIMNNHYITKEHGHFHVDSLVATTATLVESHTPIYKEVVTKVIEPKAYGFHASVHVLKEIKQGDVRVHLTVLDGGNVGYAKSEIKDMIDVLQQIYEVM